MVFASYPFIFIFLPCVLCGYGLCRTFAGANAQKVFLVASSLVFYAQANPPLVLLLCATVLFNYFCASLSQRGKTARRLALAASIAENIGLLVYFKYSNFLLSNLNRFAGTYFELLELALPLGISFFTFQILTYVSDVCRGKYPPGRLLDFSLFVTFFPQLIVGPIIRYDAMSPQLAAPGFGRTSERQWIEGVVLFCIGAFKKVIIADPLISFAKDFYSSSATANILMAWAGVVAFTFAYYFDFSGYIDMAAGLGRFFSVKLPQNFNSPYKALDFADFWRRWNMTVSRFFDDYVFKNIFGFGDRYGKLILATMATFLVSGLWHGAGWTFILWGVFNGLLVCAANIMAVKRLKLPKPVGWFLTFLFAVLARVLFDSGSVRQSAQIYKLMLDFRPLLRPGALAMLKSFAGANLGVLCLLAVSASICFFLPNSNEIADSLKPRARHAVLCGAALAVSLFFMDKLSTFLYFQF